MRGRQFLDLARRILAMGSHEVERRGAAGRAYNALLLESRDALIAWGFAPPRSDAVHAFVRDRFRHNAYAELPPIGLTLERLGRQRNWADYQLSGPVFPGVGHLQRNIDEVANAIKLLDAINADAARRIAAVAAIKARWP